MMTDDAVRARHAAATPGPWRWFGNTKFHSIYLATIHGGRRFVMNFCRWGFSGATPEFQIKRGSGGVMVEAHTLVKYEVDYRKDISGIDHPDAIFIENAWADVDYLIRENDRLRTEVNRLSQDYGDR